MELKCVVNSMPCDYKNIDASCEQRVVAGAVSLYDKILEFLCLYAFVVLLDILQKQLASTFG